MRKNCLRPFGGEIQIIYFKLKIEMLSVLFEFISVTIKGKIMFLNIFFMEKYLTHPASTDMTFF